MRFELKMDKSFLQLIRQRTFDRFKIGKEEFTLQDSRFQLALLIVIPILCFGFISKFVQNVFIYRTIFPTTIPLVLWMTIGLIPEQLKLIHRILLAGWVGVLLFFIIGWSPTAKSGNFEQIFEIVSSQQKPGDVIYHSSGTTALLFWYYMPNGKHYLLNGEVIAQVDIDIAKVDIPKSAIEDISYKRAWIVWSRTPGLRLVGRHVNLRMEGYVKDCQFMGKIENF